MRSRIVHRMKCKHESLDEILPIPSPAGSGRSPGMEQRSPGDGDGQPVHYPGLQQLRFDSRGMLLPHCILGDLEDFRRQLEARRETEVRPSEPPEAPRSEGSHAVRGQLLPFSPSANQLLKRLPPSAEDPLSEAAGRRRSDAVADAVADGDAPDHRETNALRHWNAHMEQRRRQQKQLSELLDSPVEELLMNKANRFREAQEEKEMLSRALPLLQPGYGHRVGSEFWSFPQRYGDELSGISATLTHSQLGRRRAVTYVGRPDCVRRESGLQCGESSRPVGGQRSYLQSKMEALGEFLPDVKKPDLSSLEVIGSREPLSFTTVCQSPSVEAELKEQKGGNIDPPSGAPSDALAVPALRFCGQLATWTGNSAVKQAEVAISSTVIFETLTGEAATTRLELHNQGSTAIYFNWHKLPRWHSFGVLRPHIAKRHFYFNSAPGLICPGDVHQVDFIFRPLEAGIEAERWQLNTHPLLLQGATMQVTLRGVALPRDHNANRRLFVEKKLEKAVVRKTCESMVEEVVLAVYSPEKPSTPIERYTTEEETFLAKNPKLPFLHESVEDLKRLWQEVSPGPVWDLSVETLRTAVLSLPDEEPTEEHLTREDGLQKLNALLLHLSDSSAPQQRPLSAAVLGQQLMKRLLEGMADEATQLRSLLGLPPDETWAEGSNQSITSDSTPHSDGSKDEENGGRGARPKDDNKRKDPKKPGKRKDEAGKTSKAKAGNDPQADAHRDAAGEPDLNAEVKRLYTRLLHKKVYALIQDFLDDLCALVDEDEDEEADASPDVLDQFL